MHASPQMLSLALSSLREEASPGALEILRLHPPANEQVVAEEVAPERVVYGSVELKVADCLAVIEISGLL